MQLSDQNTIFSIQRRVMNKIVFRSKICIIKTVTVLGHWRRIPQKSGRKSCRMGSWNDWRSL